MPPTPTPTSPASYPADAACAHSDLPAHTWDDEVAGETDRQRKTRVAMAKNVCRACPVADACHARRFQGGGIRAGIVHPDHIQGYNSSLFIGHVDAPEPVKIGCGTNNGYKQHRAHGEPTCAPCRKAHSRYVIDKKQEARATREVA